MIVIVLCLSHRLTCVTEFTLILPLEGLHPPQTINVLTRNTRLTTLPTSCRVGLLYEDYRKKSLSQGQGVRRDDHGGEQPKGHLEKAETLKICPPDNLQGGAQSKKHTEHDNRIIADKDLTDIDIKELNKILKELGVANNLAVKINQR